jgi:FkbM family methyltransferase
MNSGAPAITNWLDTMAWRTGFSMRSRAGKRLDKEGDWPWFERVTSYRTQTIKRQVRRVLMAFGRRPYAMTVDWMRANAENLWKTRSMLMDDVSRILFDDALLLRMTSHRHFYFPRTEFSDFITVTDNQPFDAGELPRDYLGVPLGVYTLAVQGAETTARIISTEQMINDLNKYRQYAIRRSGFGVAPQRGEVVLDCGACIGDYTVIFAAMVGTQGEVHAFDPVPLHNRYCALQASLNPSLSDTMRFNTLAVAAHTSSARSPAAEDDRINPSLRVDVDSFDFTSLDDYAAKSLQRVDFIKMDIEGAEMDAIEGAKEIIRAFKPRLAISCYHKPADLWEIPQKLMSLNPGYKLAFGHHSPVQWESVFYAVQPE